VLILLELTKKLTRREVKEKKKKNEKKEDDLVVIGAIVSFQSPEWGEEIEERSFILQT